MARLLVVDDDLAILQLVKKRMEIEGHEVHTSNEALGTSRRVRELKPDILILDQQMPALTGTNVIKILGDLGGERPKVMLYSALSPDEVEKEAKKAGADAFLCKTDGMEALSRKIRELLGQS